VGRHGDPIGSNDRHNTRRRIGNDAVEERKDWRSRRSPNPRVERPTGALATPAGVKMNSALAACEVKRVTGRSNALLGGRKSRQTTMMPS